jgi:hypothetical protein
MNTNYTRPRPKAELKKSARHLAAKQALPQSEGAGLSLLRINLNGDEMGKGVEKMARYYVSDNVNILSGALLFIKVQPNEKEEPL